MSYCRFSTNDYQCDLYVYATDEDLYQIHVAAYRRVFASPLPPPVKLTPDTLEAYTTRELLVQEMVRDAEFERIVLPLAGEHFCEDAEETARVLEMLRDFGYRFPCSIIEEIRNETQHST